jgi:hypothetical protein
MLKSTKTWHWHYSILIYCIFIRRKHLYIKETIKSLPVQSEWDNKTFEINLCLNGPNFWKSLGLGENKCTCWSAYFTCKYIISLN